MAPQPSAVRIAITPEEQASGETAEIYDDIRDHFGRGFVPDVFQLLGTHPRFLQNLWDTYLAIFDTGALPREVKELIAVSVARDAACPYCVTAHTMLAQTIGASPETLAAIASDDPNPGTIEPNFQALLDFVAQIDTAAYRITDADVDRLRELGWTDPELVETIWTACVFNAIVRLVNTLGLAHFGQLVPRR